MSAMFVRIAAALTGRKTGPSKPFHGQPEAPESNLQPWSRNASKPQGLPFTLAGSFNNMLIRIGYDIIYRLPRPVPMLLMLSVHPSRSSSIVEPESLRTEPETP